MSGQLVLVHLSDIHFDSKVSGTRFDLDILVRNELERDAERMIKRIGIANGILVTGDIAYSGYPEEYKKAQAWLTHFAKNKVFCANENIWTIPGNHDVDREIIKKSSVIRSLHGQLRGAKKVQKIDAQIRGSFLDDPEAKAALLRPLQNYIEFTKVFEGDLKRDNVLYWEYDLKLNDNSTLRLRGLNSTLVSDLADDDGANKLILGSAQVMLPREDGVEYLTLCHHPPDWFHDRDNVDEHLRSLCRIQLFGHKHRQTIVRFDESVRIIAGATHPSREEDEWVPRYNFLSLAVTVEDGKRKLVAKVYPRVWNSKKTFQGDYDKEGADERTITFSLSDWQEALEKPAEVLTLEKNAKNLRYEKTVSSSPDKGEINMNPVRRLTYRFLSLPFNKRLRIAIDLGLIREEDEGLREVDLFKNIFQRARDNSKLGSLWDKVEEAHANGEKVENPFK